MTYTPKQYAAALFQSLQDTKPAGHDQILDNFVAILRQNGDLGKLPEIETVFYDFERDSEGIKLASVTAARELSKTEQEKIVHALNLYAGSKVELKEKVDERLIGGIVVKIGDEMIDGSVERSFMDLKNNLEN